MSLAIRLKQARQKKQLTQADLATAIGVKQQAIQRIEAGKVKTSSYIVQMAKILDVSPEWLVLGDISNNVPFNSSTTSNHTTTNIPLIEWGGLNNLTHALSNATQFIPTISKIGLPNFAIRVTDESMHGSDGAKLGFHRQDILIVDGSRSPHDGDFVITQHHGRFLFRQYINDGPSAYLKALHSHYESFSCDTETKFYGVVINRITNFL